MQMDAGVIMSRMSCRTRFVRISHLLTGTFMVNLSGNSLLQRFRRDQSGTYMIVAALAMPVLVGTAGLGTEAGWWLYTHKNMQSAADSAAVSAATAGSNLNAEADSVTALYGFTNGTKNVAVTVNQPPSTGNYTTSPQAIEVLISQPQPRLLSALFGTDPVLIKARAVALPKCRNGLRARARPDCQLGREGERH